MPTPSRRARRHDVSGTGLWSLLVVIYVGLVLVGLLAGCRIQDRIDGVEAGETTPTPDPAGVTNATTTGDSADIFGAALAGGLDPPVDAPVLDPFRLPEGPYGPGNRGIEYDTEAGDPVRAAAAGTVVFAGAVAGELHVTLDHGPTGNGSAGRVLSSYSFLDRINAAPGRTVERGQVIGLAGETFHFGLRVAGAYVDPADFTAVRSVTVRLVPTPDSR